MKKELDDKLCKDFPEIFADRHAPMNQTAMCWGFDVGDGWEPLIRNLCKELMAIGVTPPTATQVKEKFGGLRFYTYNNTDQGFDLINKYEEMSYTICEICGESGTPNRHGWIKTRCEAHKDD